MKISVLKTIPLLAVVTAVLSVSGCAKKVAKVTPPPPPAPTAPTATLSASRTTLQQGQSAELTWSTTDANDITISALGTVPASGSRSVTPSISTTYQLTAKGPGGTAEASARVTVAAAPAAMSQPSEEELFARNVKDVYFDYDKYDLRAIDQPIANQNAQFLLQHPEIKVLIAGHCDDRGSEEYNLALGSSRADAIKDYLVKMGVSADRIRTISYGKEKPFCSAENDQCWQSNRRDHFGIQQ